MSGKPRNLARGDQWVRDYIEGMQRENFALAAHSLLSHVQSPAFSVASLNHQNKVAKRILALSHAFSQHVLFRTPKLRVTPFSDTAAKETFATCACLAPVFRASIANGLHPITSHAEGLLNRAVGQLSVLYGRLYWKPG